AIGTEGIARVFTCVGNDDYRDWHYEPSMFPDPVPDPCTEERMRLSPGSCTPAMKLPNPLDMCTPFRVYVQRDIEVLSSRYDRMAKALQENLQFSKIYITECFDPSHDDDGNLCRAAVFEHAVADDFSGLVRFLADIGPDGIIDSSEIEWAHDHVIIP